MDEPSTKRRRGGQRQRLEGIEDLTDIGGEQQRPSALATLLEEKWSWGELSPQDLQKIAAAAVADFQSGSSAPAELSFLAGLGTGGRFANNMHKELLQHTSKACKMEKPFSCMLPFKAPWQKQLSTMLLPHQLFANLFHNYGAVFEQIVVPNRRALTEFWSLQRNHPAFESHPLVGAPGFDPSHTIPISLHGDGTPVVGIGKIWSRQLTTFTWTSMVGQPGLTKETLFPIFFFFDETDKDSCKEFFKVLSWSINSLQEGVWPDRDHLGRMHLGPDVLFTPDEENVFLFLFGQPNM